jgi:RimJ/RimL family protein N-acetyltransferase
MAVVPRNELARPPEWIDAGQLVVRRATVADAEAISVSVLESLDHLRSWMPWATTEMATVEAQTRRLAEDAWDADTEYGYVMVTEVDPGIVGACGLHRRGGAGCVEIGYWVHVSHTGRGYATAAAKALEDAAWSLPDVERVEIHCDAGNTASAAIARRLGFRLDRTESHSIDAPGECGRHMIWVRERGAGQPPAQQT